MEKTNEEEKIEATVNDEAELDKVLEDSINEVKAGKALTPAKEEVKVEEKKEETPETPKPEDSSTPPVVDEKKEGEYEYRIPNKGKFESDESYEKRIELMDLVKRRKLAKTDEQKQQISEQIQTTKSQIKNLNGTDKLINPLNQKSGVEAEKKVEVEDEATKADRERLKQLGGATKEDIQEIVQQERLATEVKNTLEKFVDRHTELKDIDTREVFFDFVDSNYNWQNKSGKELMTVLELARESMFKPSETITERVLKGADVQNKVNAMQFPGGTIAKQDYSPEMKESVKELVATGMSEEKAVELLTD
jgi:hypothetical protein